MFIFVFLGLALFSSGALALIQAICWEMFAETSAEVQPRREVSIHTSLWAHCKHPAGKRKHFLCPRITCFPIEREFMFPDRAYGTWKRLHPEGRVHRWPKSTPRLPSLGGTWGRTCSRMCSRCWRSITRGILFLPCSKYNIIEVCKERGWRQSESC